MRIGILQPGYLPWLGFFEQMHRADVFVIYDDVQYDKNGWRNRNRIKTASGPQWLTVPVRLEFSEKPRVRDVLIDNTSNWARKHLLSVRQNYSRAPFFGNYFPVFEEAYARKWEKLIDLDMHFIRALSGMLGLDTGKLRFSSDVPLDGSRTDRLIQLCRHFGADTFYEGAAGKDYIDAAEFARLGVTVEFQDYAHPTYSQLHGEFIPYLSTIDLLFNHGPESARILLKAQ